MSDWKPVVEAGDIVSTPHGQGRVRRVSGTSDSAQVEVDGQLYEVSLNEVHATGGEPEGGQPQPKAKPFYGHRAKAGDRVQHKAAPHLKGEVTEVTQRTIKVKWDTGNGANFPKRTASQRLQHEQAGAEQPKPEQKPENKQEQKSEQPKSKVEETGDGLHDIFKLKDYLEKKIDDSVDGELKDLKEQVKKTRKLEVKVGDKVNIIEGMKHKQLEQLITYAMMRLNTLLVGMAGTGKTHAGEQVAEALDLPFYSLSVGAQTSQSNIVGFIHANGGYVRTHFRDAYENGGVFLMDEIDAGNANVLISVNSALSNGYMSFPDAIVKKHKDFVFVASANTFGNGANRQYVGRNQLDAATLDRFAIIEWLIDDDLEESLAVGLNGKAWYMAVRACRDYVAEKNIRALISPRATQKGSKLLDVGQPVDEVIHATMLGSVPEDKKSDVKEVAVKIFEKFASEVPSKISKAVNPEVSQLIR